MKKLWNNVIGNLRRERFWCAKVVSNLNLYMIIEGGGLYYWVRGWRKILLEEGVCVMGLKDG